MSAQITSPQLGQNVLVVIDSTPGYFEAFHQVITSLPYDKDRFFTIFCCCPPQYWEHGGAGTPEVQQQIKDVWESEQKLFSQAEHCMQRAKSILQSAAVDVKMIRTRIATEDSVVDATINELRRDQYSGIIVYEGREDIINRLRGKGFTDIFRQIPKVEICTVSIKGVGEATG